MTRPSYITASAIDLLVSAGLAEDVGPGDITTTATIDGPRMSTASIVAKESGVIAGLFVAERVFRLVDNAIKVQWTYSDGMPADAGVAIGQIHGRAGSLLIAERLALNFMQRMSGIATATRAMVDATAPHKARILDTRKTVPGLRITDKWAVLLGGGNNHRMGLHDMFLIKDNHIAAAGGIEAAIGRVREYADRNSIGAMIEIEVRTLAELATVLNLGGVDRVLLDNMASNRGNGVDTTMLAHAVSLVAGRIQTEASGNVTLATVGPIAATGVDYISCGGLTHSVRALDISMSIELD